MYFRVNFEVHSGYGGPFLSIPVSKRTRPFPAGDPKAHINRRAQRHSKHKTEQKHERSTKEVPPWNGQ